MNSRYVMRSREQLLKHLNKPRSRIQICPKRFSSYGQESLPRVAQPALWHSFVPKFLRKDGSQHKAQPGIQRAKSKDWNPYTFFIIISLLIGSNSINMIALRRDFASYSRKADAKIALLNEAIERVLRGEEVDVKGLLGTGDPQQEQEWEEGMALYQTMVAINGSNVTPQFFERSRPKTKFQIYGRRNEMTIKTMLQIQSQLESNPASNLLVMMLLSLEFPSSLRHHSTKRKTH